MYMFFLEKYVSVYFFFVAKITVYMQLSELYINKNICMFIFRI